METYDLECQSCFRLFQTYNSKDMICPDCRTKVSDGKTKWCNDCRVYYRDEVSSEDYE